eukprot:606319-Lingulodinium_polyedra.AAC.1
MANGGPPVGHGVCDGQNAPRPLSTACGQMAATVSPPSSAHAWHKHASAHVAVVPHAGSSAHADKPCGCVVISHVSGNTR